MSGFLDRLHERRQFISRAIRNASLALLAVGGGATILFFCDVLYVGESLRLRVPFTSLGMAPEFASTYMLQARIGTQRAAEILLSSKWIDADEAVACAEAGVLNSRYLLMSSPSPAGAHRRPDLREQLRGPALGARQPGVAVGGFGVPDQGAAL